MTRQQREYEDIYYDAPDGLKLYARRYSGLSEKPVLLCMHGLTRNSADFHPLAELLPDYRLISVDQRGRGRSAYDPNPDNYRPDVYCGDMFALLDYLGLEKVIAVGTSMGGIMTMMMAAMRPGIFSAAIINDIGPEVSPIGLNRLRKYVGKSTEFEDWDVAAASIKAQGPALFPDFMQDDWVAFAKRTCEVTTDGKVRFAYDPGIQSGIKEDNATAAPVDMWPLFESLLPVDALLIRGENSDILTRSTASEMVRRHNNLTWVDIPGRGHAPLLTEPAAVAAIENFLEGQAL